VGKVTGHGTVVLGAGVGDATAIGVATATDVAGAARRRGARLPRRCTAAPDATKTVARQRKKNVVPRLIVPASFSVS
jgi:hypothetical protein